MTTRRPSTGTLDHFIGPIGDFIGPIGGFNEPLDAAPEPHAAILGPTNAILGPHVAISRMRGSAIPLLQSIMAALDDFRRRRDAFMAVANEVNPSLVAFTALNDWSIALTMTPIVTLVCSN